jgi:two-component system, cell cycle sensor histidine kinase and response regulator CckA
VPRTIDLALDLPSDLPTTEADPSQIQQVVMNLILNAVEATGERPGCVRISTGLHYVRPGDPVGHYRPDPPAPGHYVRIEVRDNGCGMNEAVRQQIFDPFFTTKFLGRGLGLAAALGIVRGHKGAIGVESLEKVGSTFTVLLPATARPASGRLGERHTLQSPEPSAGVILLIDDEDLVRHAARAALEHAGFTVFEACDGQDGTDLFSRLHDRVSAVLVDLTMPRLDGHGVWEYIRRLRPDMRVIISSGFDESEAMRQFGSDPSLAFLQKPYTAAALTEKIRGVLER